MTVTKKALETFTKKATAVSAVVSEVGSLAEALQYTVELCDKKQACELLVSGCELPLSGGAAAQCDEKQTKVIAAPGLAKKDFNALSKLCKERDLECIDGGLRSRLAGIDVGFTVCDLGIAETGSLVLNSASEEVRLATMISEVHVAVLPKSKLKNTSYEAEPEILKFMKAAPNYLAFITGASRTADIERVLALGVHGPLELHILLMEDK